MIDFDLYGNLVLDRDGLALLIFVVASLSGGLASLITWLGLRSQYPPPDQQDTVGDEAEAAAAAPPGRDDALRIEIPAPDRLPLADRWPAYRSGRARPMPPLPVTAIQPALDEHGSPR